MQRFERETGIAAPLPLPNIDTDVVMPKQFLKRIDREGLAEGAFHDVRYDADGRERPDFVLNRPRFRSARFLVAGRNFGCGSSREHAVWGLLQNGIRAIVAPSFAGIFFGNCEKNGLLAITLEEEAVARLLCRLEDADSPEITIGLENCRITDPDGVAIGFQIAAARRRNCWKAATISAKRWPFQRRSGALKPRMRSASAAPFALGPDPQ